MRKEGEEQMPEGMEISELPENYGGIMAEHHSAGPQLSPKDHDKAFRLSALETAMKVLGEAADPRDVLSLAKEYADFIENG